MNSVGTAQFLRLAGAKQRLAVAANYVALAGDIRQLAEGGQIGLSEHLGHRLEGRLVQLVEPIKRAVERDDPQARHRTRAIVEVHRIEEPQEIIDTAGEEVALARRTRVEELHADQLHQVGRTKISEHALREEGNVGVRSDLRNDNRAHSLESRGAWPWKRSLRHSSAPRPAMTAYR